MSHGTVKRVMCAARCIREVGALPHPLARQEVMLARVLVGRLQGTCQIDRRHGMFGCVSKGCAGVNFLF